MIFKGEFTRIKKKCFDIDLISILFSPILSFSFQKKKGGKRSQLGSSNGKVNDVPHLISSILSGLQSTQPSSCFFFFISIFGLQSLFQETSTSDLYFIWR